MEQFHNQAQLIESQLIDIRRFLHRNPEISWKEVRTTAYLMAMATQFQLNATIHPFTNSTGFYLDLGPENTPKILWRTDIDALPIDDRKSKTYQSAFSGVGHLCGHDVHSVIALGVAKLLSDKPLKKGIRILFQPAEESSPSGAPQMIKEGVLENVESILAIHCDPTNPSKTISIGIGSQTASFDGFHVRLKSDSTTHSARPHSGKDVIWIANQLMNLWYGSLPHVDDVREPAVLAITQINSGVAINVIPDELIFSGTLRCSSEKSRNMIKEWLLKSVDSYKHLFAIDAELHFDEGSPAVINQKELTEKVISYFESHLVVKKSQQSMGGEDFGWYSQLIPATFIRLGSSDGENTSFPLHHNCFDVDESIIAFACAEIAGLIHHLQLEG